MIDDVGFIDRLSSSVVGRQRELELLAAALAANRHVLFEGPPGTGKSTILRSFAANSGSSLVFVEGNAELTPPRLSGQFDPSRVIAEGYATQVFVAGPLVEALKSGSLLYVEELNRVPEETINLLITVMSEGELTVPRLGRIEAAEGFQLIAAMNPFDNIGTARVSSAIYDRMSRISLDYQSFDEERDIVRLRVGASDPTETGEPTRTSETLLRRAVAITRATRSHPDLRIGSSVRGAIDLFEIATRLAAIRATALDDQAVGLDSALVAISGRIRPHEGTDRAPEEIVTELWESVIAAEQRTSSSADPGKAQAPQGATAQLANHSAPAP